MPAETNTGPTALGGTKPSPDEPASNRARQDFGMPRTPRHSREPCPGRRPAPAPLRPSGGREPAPDAIRGRGPVATAAGRVRWEPCTREIPARELLFLDPGGHPGAPVIPAKAGPQSLREGDGQPAGDREPTREILF